MNISSPPYKIRGKIDPAVARLWYRFYRNDIETHFASLVLEAIKPNFHVLEIGAGSGIGDQQFFGLKGKAAKYVGVDLDPRVKQNPHLDEAFIADAATMPFESESFDLVFHTMVAEHLTDPLKVLNEIRRVLKPGGILLFETVNKWYYPMVLSSLTPHWFHTFYIERFASGRKAEDVFPTVYKLNTFGQIKQLSRLAGYSNVQVDYISLPPGYLRSNRFMFMLGVAYERFIERLFTKTRGRIVVTAIK